MRDASREDSERKANQVAHLENALRHAREEARDHADKLETARADNSMLQGAIDALRKDHERTRNSSPAEAPLDARDVAALRREIVELGAQMLDAPPAQRAQ